MVLKTITSNHSQCRMKTKTKMEGTCQQPKKIGKIVSSNSKDHIKQVICGATVFVLVWLQLAS